MSVRDLNPPQRAAVQTLAGPLLVLAGAGTGKTRVITYRIARLIEHGVRPSRILAVTFTNKAAREMKQRAVSLLGKRRRKTETPEISTFHSLCVRILRRHATRLGYPAEFSIYDRGDQESVARAALRDIRVGHEKLRPGDLLALIGGWKTHSVRPDRAEEIAENDKQQLAALAYVRYQTALKASGALDFDDLLLCTEELFEKHADVRFAEAGRFDHLLIDEYQDTNALQYRIVRALAERHRNLCVVGDDDQSIYGWRGAEVAHILSFERDWPDSKVVRLEDNYRSRAPILELANTLIAHNSARHDKLLRAYRGEGPAPRFVRFENETEEAEGIVGEIERRLDPEGSERAKASDLAILFRTNEQPRAFELELRRRRIPYLLVGGQSFYDRKEIKDLLSYLKLLANPADEVALLRVINTPARGIGTSSVQVVLEQAVSAGVSLWNMLPTAGDDGSIPHAAAQRIAGFRAVIERYRARLGGEPLAGVVSDLIGEIAYRAELERIYKNPGDVEARWHTIEELVNSVALYESRHAKPTLLGFLEETALAGREDQRDDDDKRTLHAVTLMTLHSAKGLEFPHVYLAGMEEGLLPHQRTVAEGSRNIDEERRLCYVGVTRAQDSLTLTFCRTRMKWGKAQPAIPSRFLMEMRGETERARRAAEASEKLFGSVPPPPPAPAPDGAGASLAVKPAKRRRKPQRVDRARGRHDD
jgi:DNA helicase II / ATP-dependent DNA helicase PcrA